MISWRSADDGKVIAVCVKKCFRCLATSDCTATVVTESCHLSFPSTRCRQLSKPPPASSMVVHHIHSEERRKEADILVRVGDATADPHQGELFAHSQTQQHQQQEYQCQEHPPPSPRLLCLEDPVPMVALECELPLSGRLSPPADVSMSAPFLSVVSSSSSDGDRSDSEVVSVAADTDRRPAEPSGVASPLNNVRVGCKRKLSQRNDQICEAKEEETARDRKQDVRCCELDQDASVTCGRCGDSCSSGESESKRRRLHEQAEESGLETNSVLESAIARDEVIQCFTGESKNNGWAEEAQQVNFVVEKTLDGIVTASDGSLAAEEEDSLVVDEEASESFGVAEESQANDVVEETVSVVEDAVSVVEDADSIVEVDVVGDDTTDAPTQPHQHYHHCTTTDVCMQDSATVALDSDQCCGDEVSSEDGEDDSFSYMSHRPHRISPFLNTPKQRKEERRKILKLSIHKMRAVEDPEHFLRRSVLINNTMKRLQRELREEKMRSSGRRGCYGLYRRASSLHYDVLNNSYLLHDEPFAISENDRITDDMTDALVTRLEATSSPVVPTPSPSPCPADQPDTSCMEFPTSSSSSSSSSASSLTVCGSTLATCSLDVTSTVAEPPTTLPAELVPPISELSSSMSEDHLLPSMSGQSVLTESEVMSTTVSDLTSSVSSTSSSSASSASSGTIYEGVFGVSSVVRDAQSPSSSCSSESQREKQLYADIDTVFNNLIHALGDS